MNTAMREDYLEKPMNLKGKKITVHDMTLRDGMHPKRHLMTLAQMVSIATGLDEAGVPLIEVTHGDGLGGSSVNYGFPAHTDEEYLSAVIPKMKQAKICTPSASPPTVPRPTSPNSTSPWRENWRWIPSAS
jgi:hypothetical protein